jgi:hypothetical protein
MSHSFQKTEPGFTQNDAFQIHTLNPSEKPPPAPSAQSHVSAPVEACHPPLLCGQSPTHTEAPYFPEVTRHQCQIQPPHFTDGETGTPAGW